jgi:orotate phosphoribosyltransferase
MNFRKIRQAWIAKALIRGIITINTFDYFSVMTNEKAIAEKLLQINAIQLNIKKPFVWASGWKSPIYCDNRKVLSYPYIRDLVKSEMCNLIFDKFPEAEMLAGVATAGIAWGAMAADQLKLPFVYVRAKAKEHGLGNQVEGHFEAGNKVVVVEDLISTGKSSLQVVEALRAAGLQVCGLVSIFSYGFQTSTLAFEKAGIPFISLTSYATLIRLAIEKGIFSDQEEAILLKWREDPSSWSGL